MERKQMELKIVEIIQPLSLVCLLLVQGCVTPEDAKESAERALRKTQDIQAQHDMLEQRTSLMQENAKTLEQKVDADRSNGYAKIRETLTLQDTKNKEDRDRLMTEFNTRLDEVHKQMELLRSEIINAIQRTNGAIVQKVEKHFDSLNGAVGTILLRTEELEKRLEPPRKHRRTPN